MKLTRHNGRSGRKGTYNPKHNDRRFDVKNSEHIDEVDGWKNVYWDCYQGFHYGYEKEQDDARFHSFEDVEKVFYFERYDKYCTAQHERNRSRGHSERNRSTEDLRMDKKTCPEETIIQIGTMEHSIHRKFLKEVAMEYFEEFEQRFGKYVHILEWSLHVDEATPHIHERHVFDCENRYGEIAPQQEKALESLGIPLPHPDKKPGRNNNRKMKFDSICRTMLLDIAKKHGIWLDEVPEYGGREYLEKQDYIAMKQKNLLAEQKQAIKENEQKLISSESKVQVVDTRLGLIGAVLEMKETKIDEKETELAKIQKQISQEETRLQELQIKLADEEAFIEDAAQTAYEAAVTAVTEKVVEETHNMDSDRIDRFRERIITDMPHSPGIRKIVYDTLGTLLEEFRNMTRHISERIRQILDTPSEKISIQKMIQDDLRTHVRLSHREMHAAEDQSGDVREETRERRGRSR